MIRSASSTMGLSLVLASGFSVASGCSSSPRGIGGGDAGSPDGFSPPTVDARADADLGMNDVSILVPLPKTVDASANVAYLAPDTAGRGGVLFPEDVYARMPVATPTVTNFERATLKGVAVRFDGCFRKEKSDPCEAQIRIVMQPLASSIEGGGTGDEHAEATDSAVHLFYRVADPDFAKVVSELRKLRSLAPETALGSALQVHPTLVAQGIEGAYGKALFHLIRNYAGAENLSRVTFFIRTPSNADQWDFGGIVKSGTDWKPLTIPGVGEKQRVTLATAGLASDYEYDVTPVATVPENLTVALSAELMAKASNDGRQTAIAAIMRVENPRMHSADQIQCVSCHVARPIAVLAAQTYAMDLTKFPDTYTSATGRNLTHAESPVLAPASVLRGFGWSGSAPAISLRVVHESAEVLDDLDKRFPKDP